MTWDEDGSHDEADEEQLEKTDPEMPGHRAQLMKVHLAKRDEQHQEHKHREDGFENRVEELCCRFQLGRKGKDEIEQTARTHRYRQCPVFKESYNRRVVSHLLLLTTLL